MEVPRHWRLKAQRYRLEGLLCLICGRLTFPPRLVCPDCAAQPAQTADGELSMLPASYRTADSGLLKG